MAFNVYRTPFLPDGFLLVKYDFIDENFLFWKNAVSMFPIEKPDTLSMKLLLQNEEELSSIKSSISPVYWLV